MNKRKGPKGRIKRPPDYRKTTIHDIATGNCERRDYRESSGYFSQMGRSRIRIECPFCLTVVTCYLWSMAGTGKRCRCGALITSYGHAWKVKQLDNEPGPG